jgi:hypothetical protein
LPFFSLLENSARKGGVGGIVISTPHFYYFYTPPEINLPEPIAIVHLTFLPPRPLYFISSALFFYSSSFFLFLSLSLSLTLSYNIISEQQQRQQRQQRQQTFAMAMPDQLRFDDVASCKDYVVQFDAELGAGITIKRSKTNRKGDLQAVEFKCHHGGVLQQRRVGPASRPGAESRLTGCPFHWMFLSDKVDGFCE